VVDQYSSTNIEDLNQWLNDFQEALKNLEINVKNSVEEDEQKDFLDAMKSLKKLEKFGDNESLIKVASKLVSLKNKIETFKNSFIDQKLELLKQKVDWIDTEFEDKFDVFEKQIIDANDNIQEKLKTESKFGSSAIWQKLQKWGIFGWIVWSFIAVKNFFGKTKNFFKDAWNWLFKKKDTPEEKTTNEKAEEWKKNPKNESQNDIKNDDTLFDDENPDQDEVEDDIEDGNIEDIETDDTENKISEQQKLLDDNDISDVSYDALKNVYVFDWESIDADEIQTLEDLEERKSEIEEAVEENIAEETVQNDYDTKHETELDTKISPGGAAVWIGSGILAWSWTLVAWNKIVKNSEYMPKNIDIKAHKASLKKFGENIDEMLKNGNLSSTQKARLKDYQKLIETTSKNLNKETIKSLAAWKSVSDQIPKDIFQTLKITEKTQKSLGKIIKKLDASDFTELSKLKKIASKNKTDYTEARIKYLKIEKKIKISNPNVIKLLGSAQDLDTLKAIAQTVKWAKWLKALWRTIAFMSLDVASFFLDFWFRKQWLKEAKEMAKTNTLRAQNKVDQTNFLFYSWLGFSTYGAAVGLTTAIATLAGSWPPWWAMLVVWWTLAWAEITIMHTAETMYYWVKDFYLQRAQLYWYRTTTKQFVYSAMYSQDLNKNETRFFSDKEINKYKDDAKTAGWEALVFLDKMEWMKKDDLSDYDLIYDFVNSGVSRNIYEAKLEDSSEENYDPKNYLRFQNQRSKFVWPRMKYITNEVLPKYEWDNPKDITWDEIENALRDSKKYEKMISDKSYSGEQNIVSYQKWYKWNIEKKYPQKYSNLNKIFEKSEEQFLDLYHGSLYFKKFLIPVTEDGTVKSEEWRVERNKILQDSVDVIEEFYKIKQSELSVEKELSFGNVGFNDFDYNNIENELLNLGEENYKITPHARSDSEVEYFYSNDFISEKLAGQCEYSESLGQNVVYRLLKEFHGYTGSNEMFELIAYAQENYKNQIWIYYENGWKINAAGLSIDKKIDISIFDEIDSLYDLNKLDDTNIPNIDDASDYVLEKIFIKKWLLSGKQKEHLDTPVESPDHKINKTFLRVLKKIIKEELEYRIEKRNEIIVEIINYIKKSTKDKDKYVQIPSRLNSQSIRAWIGDLNYFFFAYETYEEDADSGNIFEKSSKMFDRKHKLIIKTSPWYQNKKISGLGLLAKLEYEELSNNVDYTEEEKSQIDYVNVTKNKLTKLIEQNKNKLKIPPEYQKLIKNSLEDRESFEKNICILKDGKYQLANKYEDYHNIFEWRYLWILWYSHKKSMEILKPDFKSVQQTMYHYLLDDILVIENKNALPIKKTLKINPEHLLDGFEHVFYDIIENYRFFDKYPMEGVNSEYTISDLLQDEWTQQLWIDLSKQVLIALIEDASLDFSNKKNKKKLETSDIRKITNRATLTFKVYQENNSSQIEVKSDLKAHRENEDSIWFEKRLNYKIKKKIYS